MQWQATGRRQSAPGARITIQSQSNCRACWERSKRFWHKELPEKTVGQAIAFCGLSSKIQGRRRNPIVCPTLQYKLPHPQEDLLLDSAILALEDRTVFEGRSFGAPVERSGEVV